MSWRRVSKGDGRGKLQEEWEAERSGEGKARVKATEEREAGTKVEGNENCGSMHGGWGP